MNILLVEENAVIRRLMRSFIGAQDHRFNECADGAAALAAYLRQQPDWVVIDIALPGVDGLTATRQIIAADPHARVLIITAYDDADLRQAAQTAGARGYLLKENLCELPGLLTE